MRLEPLVKEKRYKGHDGIVLLLVFVSCLSKLLGFLRDIVLTNTYGAGMIADAYITTLSIPDMVLEVIGQTALIGFVPLALEKMNESEDELNSFTSSVLKMLFLVSCICAILMFSFAPFVIDVLAPGFEGETFNFATFFLKCLCFSLVAKSITSVFFGYLNAKHFFVPGAFLGVLLDVSIIAFILISDGFRRVNLLPFGVLLGVFLQIILMVPFAYRKGFKPIWSAPTYSVDIKRLLVISVPAVMSVGLMQISSLFNRALVSGMEEGGITMLSHASRISFFAENIIVSSVATVLYPLLSEHHLKGEEDKFRYVLSDAVDKLLFFLIPATVGLFVLSDAIIEILYGHGEFTAENVKITAVLMRNNIVGIVGVAIQTVLTRSLFSMKKIKLSVILSLSLLATYISCSYIMACIGGLQGVALATGISYSIGGLLYYIVLNRVCKGLRAKNTIVICLKSLFCSLIMAGVVLLLIEISKLPKILTVGVSVLAGACVYFLVAHVIRLRQISWKNKRIIE